MKLLKFIGIVCYKIAIVALATVLCVFSGKFTVYSLYGIPAEEVHNLFYAIYGFFCLALVACAVYLTGGILYGIYSWTIKTWNKLS